MSNFCYSHSVFKRLELQTCKIQGLFGKGFNPFPHNDTFWRPWETSLLKNRGKRRRAISPLPTVFSTCLENFLLFSSNVKLSSADCFKMDLSKILSSGNGLKVMRWKCQLVSSFLLLYCLCMSYEILSSRCQYSIFLYFCISLFPTGQFQSTKLTTAKSFTEISAKW